HLFNFNGTLLFSAVSSGGLGGLWTSDGTAGGTVLVSSIVANGDFTEVNGKLFFAGDAGSGTELCTTDGATAGTSMVKGLGPGTHIEFIPPLGLPIVTSNSSLPSDLTNVNGQLFFATVVLDYTLEFPRPSAYKLWQSDGTASGTVLVMDFPA